MAQTNGDSTNVYLPTATPDSGSYSSMKIKEFDDLNDLSFNGNMNNGNSNIFSEVSIDNNIKINEQSNIDVDKITSKESYSTDLINESSNEIDNEQINNDNSSSKGAILTNIKKLTIHTGNIINWQTIKRNPSLSSTQEIITCTKCLLRCWSKTNTNIPEITRLTPGYLKIECCTHKDTIPEEIRDQIRVTAKIYLKTMDPQHMREAILTSLNVVNVCDLDTVIIAFPPEELEQTGISPVKMRPLWDVLEQFVHQNQILRLGVSDMHKNQLEALFNLASIKPQINQVNLQYSCALPTDLNEYAKENGVQLLTHNDIPEILPTDTFCNILSNQYTPSDGSSWNIPWVCRYLTVFKNRAVIRSKGFIIAAER